MVGRQLETTPPNSHTFSPSETIPFPPLTHNSPRTFYDQDSPHTASIIFSPLASGHDGPDPAFTALPDLGHARLAALAAALDSLVPRIGPGRPRTHPSGVRSA